MGFLSVSVVHRGRGVELAGGEKFLLIDPLVRVVRDLTVPRSRRDDGDPGPRVQESTVGSAGYPIVGRLLTCEAGVSFCHRADQRFVFGGLGGRAFFDHQERSLEVGIFRGQSGEDVFQTFDQLPLGLGRHRADIQVDVGAGRDHVDLGFPAIGAQEDSGREARISEERVLTVALDLFSFQLLYLYDEPCGPRNGVDATLWHGTVRHRPTHGKLRPERALLTRAELVLLGFADDGSVHSFRVAPFDERLDARHHPLFVHRMTEYQPARERDTRVPYRGYGDHSRSQVSFGIARSPPVDTTSISLGIERRVVPILRASFCHHIRVRLEEQGLPRPGALPHGPYIRTARRNFFRLYPEPCTFQVVSHEPRDARLVPIRLFGLVDTGDTDEF